MKYENIPKELKELNQWVCVWKNSKIPMQAKIKQGASSTNPLTWSDYQTAIDSINKGVYDNIGFVFNNNGIVGIDIDCGYDDNGFLSDISVDIVKACQSFTEKSRSGRGIHIYVKGVLPFKGKNNGKGVEIYQEGRYFIVTGKKIMYEQIIENQEAIDYIINKYFSETERNNIGIIKNLVFYTPIYTKPNSNKVLLQPIYPSIPNGARNQSLTSLAGQLHSRGYSKEYIYKELLKCNSIACETPLSSKEIELIVNSITKYTR